MAKAQRRHQLRFQGLGELYAGSGWELALPGRLVRGCGVKGLWAEVRHRAHVRWVGGRLGLGGNGEQCLLGGPEPGRTPQDNRGCEKCEGLWPAGVCSAEIAVGAPRAARRARTRGPWAGRPRLWSRRKGPRTSGRQQHAGESAAVAEGPGWGNAGVVTPGTGRDMREGALGGITRALLAGRVVGVFRMPSAGCTAQAPEEGGGFRGSL